MWWHHYIEQQNQPAYEIHLSAEMVADVEVGMITSRYAASADCQVRLVRVVYS